MLGQRVFAWARRTPYLADLPRDVAVLSFVAFAVALGYGIAAPALPVYARTFGVSAFVASTVISGFALMRLLSAGPVGPAWSTGSASDGSCRSASGWWPAPR